MAKRIISGAGYVAILTVFFLLREKISIRIFNLLIWFFIALGTFEYARATRAVSIRGSFYLSIIYGVLFVPVYYLGEYFICSNLGYLFAIYFLIFMLILTCIIAFIVNAPLNKFCWTVLSYVYPALFLLSMLLANQMEFRGFIILILAFAISPFSDTFAYFVGSAIGGKKLCPKLSPKKTWSGAIGGTIGGIIASILVFYIFSPEVKFFSPILFFVIIGFLASIINIFGDLFESYIKRKMQIKDMGNIMPGHGGVLDRIDGTMFVIVFLYLVFLFV